jgi:hypothetical protein
MRPEENNYDKLATTENISRKQQRASREKVWRMATKSPSR